MHTHHILTILATDDLERSARSKHKAFGRPPAFETPVYVKFALPADQRLGVYARPAFAQIAAAPLVRPAAGEVGVAEVYLRTEDLTTAIADVQEAGGRSLSPRAWRDCGDDVAYFADPDGHVRTLAHPALADPDVAPDSGDSGYSGGEQRDAEAKRSVGTDRQAWRSSPLPGRIVLVTGIDAVALPNVASESWISVVALGPPPTLMFSCRRAHHTVRNRAATGAFVVKHRPRPPRGPDLVIFSPPTLQRHSDLQHYDGGLPVGARTTRRDPPGRKVT